MAYKVKLLHIASLDIEKICEFKSKFYRHTVSQFIENLYKNFEIISGNPEIYPPYQFNLNYRKSVVDGYLIFYKVIHKTKTVKIYRVINGARDIPRKDGV